MIWYREFWSSGNLPAISRAGSQIKNCIPQHSRDQTAFKDVNALLKFKANAYLTWFIYLVYKNNSKRPQWNLRNYVASAAVRGNIFTKAPFRFLEKHLRNFIVVVSEFSYFRQGSFPATVFDAAADGMAYQTCPKHLYKEIIILYDQGYSDQWRNTDFKCKVADME